MDDRYVWGLVAFLNELPGMTTDRYRELIEASGGHQHGGSESNIESEHSVLGDEPSSETHTHDHESNPGAEEHSETPPHQH
jgi:hypothetical protein